MTTANPLALFHGDRARARAAGDPMAALCTLATSGAECEPDLRTLVLRDVDDALAVFVNASSPKWNALQSGAALLTYWPSIQIQYRLRVTTAAVPTDVVHTSWQLRPDPPKRMDWFYQQRRAQSSPVASRNALLAELAALELPEPLHAPAQARGMLLTPIEIERLDLTQADGIHDRRRFRWVDATWHEEVLVP